MRRIAFLWVVLSALSAGCARSAPEDPPLRVFCAAAAKAPMEAFVRDFEAATGAKVETQYGASYSLLTAIEVAGLGDVYLPADDSYLATAETKGLIDRREELACMRGVLVVRRGNPDQVRSLDDALSRGLRIAQANPDAAAIGAVTRKTLAGSPLGERLAAGTTVMKTNVNEVLNDVTIGSVDVGIVWDVVAATSDKVEIVPTDELDAVRGTVAVARCRASRQPSLADRFIDRLADPSIGGKILTDHHFRSCTP